MQQIDGHRLINFASQLDPKVLDQAKKAASLPFIYPHIALMPDAHYGSGASVGAVIPTRNAIIPSAIGGDIGCGMSAVRTRFAWDQVDSLDLADLRDALQQAIPLGMGKHEQDQKRSHTRRRISELDDLARAKHVDLKHSPGWPSQLGSLGGGNHFIELCVDQEDIVWLFLHSGSRGVGARIAGRHIKIAQKLCDQWHVQLPDRDLAYLPQGTSEFSSYLTDMHWALQFAQLNRDEMMDRFMQCFADWAGVEAQRVAVDRISCHHNYTRMENHYGTNVWVTRKGAVAAYEDQLGLIPGSMGANSYVVRGRGFAPSLCSSPHGAGRQFSRRQAREKFSADDLAQAMRGIEYIPGEQYVDEHPGAYKDIDVVMADSERLVLVEHTLTQKLNLKGT